MGLGSNCVLNLVSSYWPAEELLKLDYPPVKVLLAFDKASTFLVQSLLLYDESSSHSESIPCRQFPFQPTDIESFVPKRLEDPYGRIVNGS